MSLSNNTAGIRIPAPFDLGTPQPLDVRYTVSTVKDLEGIINKYDGLITYVKEDHTHYKYNEKNGSWELFGTTMYSIEGYPANTLGLVGDWALNNAGSLYHKEKSEDGAISWVSKAIMGGGGNSGHVDTATVEIGISYSSIEEMNMMINKAENNIVAIINAIDSPDNAKLFKKTLNGSRYEWKYLGQISGPAGKDGADGKSPTIQIGNVATGDPDTEVTIENSGTETDVVLDITIPKGARGPEGEKGEKGDPGPQGAPSIVNGKVPEDGAINLTLDDIPDGENRKLIGVLDVKTFYD